MCIFAWGRVIMRTLYHTYTSIEWHIFSTHSTLRDNKAHMHVCYFFAPKRKRKIK